MPPQTMSKKELKDLKILALFTSFFCQCKHVGGKEIWTMNDKLPVCRGAVSFQLCPDCQVFVNYAIGRRLRCPLIPKPSCRKCYVHCYHPMQRKKVKEIMRFSGKNLIKRGRFDLLLHWIF